MKAYNLHTALRQPEKTTGLFLNHQRLKEVPEQIRQLPNLQLLDLSHNQLITLPDWLSQLPKLTTLVLSHNSFGEWPNATAQLPVLEQLSIDHNALEEMGALPRSIQLLSIQHNQLTTLSEALCLLSALKQLRLTGNLLRQLPRKIGQLRNLTLLQLNDNRLQRLPKSIGQCSRLEQLYVAQNRLSKVPDNLGQLAELRQLDLGHNRIRVLPGSIGQCIRLRQLVMPHNKLSKLPKTLGQLQWLAKLSVHHNQLTRLPVQLCECQRLSLLNIGHNQIDRLPRQLSQLNNLHDLHANHNQLRNLPNLPKRLEHLELRRNAFDTFPTNILRSQWLCLIDLSYNQIKELPPAIGNFQRLVVLKMQHNPIAKFQSNLLLLDQLEQAPGVLPGIAQKRFFPFLRGCQQQKITGDDRLALYAILDGKSTRSPSIKQVFQLLRFRLHEARLQASALLFRQSKPPLKRGDALTVLGKTHLPKTILRPLLENQDIAWNTTITNETQHVLIGQRPPFHKKLEQATFHFWSEQQLIEWLDQQPERHLAKATTKQINHLRHLLYHQEIKHPLLALQMLRGGGVPKSLLTDLFIVQASTSNALLKKGLRQLLALYLNDQTWAILQWPVAFSWKPAHRKRMQGYLKQLGESGMLEEERILDYLKNQ